MQSWGKKIKYYYKTICFFSIVPLLSVANVKELCKLGNCLVYACKNQAGNW